MITADAVRSVLLVLAAVTAGVHQPAWVLVVLVVCCASVSAFHAPAERRFQRDAIAPDQRASFNAVIGATGTTVIVVAPALGGLIITVVGNVGALALDALSFLLSLVFVARVSGPLHTVSPKNQEQAASAGKGALATALGAMQKDPTVLACFLAQAVACTVAGASLVLLPLLGDRLDVGAGTVGWLTAAVGAGSVLGVLIGGSIAKNGRVVLGVTSVVSMGVILGLLGSSPNLVVALLCAVLAGTAANIPEPLYWTSYADRVTERDSSAFYGLVESSITGGFALGGVILGAAAAVLGTSIGTWVVGVAGSLIAATALIPALCHRRALKATLASPAPTLESVS